MTAPESPPESPRESPRERANRTQRDASDPAVSAFVAASAGSGKTKLLTDRLLRLMLADGVRPERIQCLTFTKAAAAEMSLRLQRLLGEWVTLDDAPLDDRLRALALEPTDTLRKRARALFANVLDLPGGMRIGTIHAFCQSLLRRFPLEARLSPHFQLIDDRDAEEARTDAREAMLATAEDGEPMRAALETLAGLVAAKQFGDDVSKLQKDESEIPLWDRHDLESAQQRVLGVVGTSAASILAEAVACPHETALRETVRIVAAEASDKIAKRALVMLDWLGSDSDARQANWKVWCKCFLTAENKLLAPISLVNKKLADRKPALLDVLMAEGNRILAVDERRRAAKVAEISAALLRLAVPVLRDCMAHKARAGLLDYADLIVKTANLLLNPGAAWVLYKLDGGLDHLLLDEVQDIAPRQWEIAHSLTAEFFAGEGARDQKRTVFAVGDRKQSIYGFQGADVATFEESRQRIAQRVGDAGEVFRPLTLDVSFRSTRPVLELVDAVFADPQARSGVVDYLPRSGVVEDTAVLTHLADRADHAGSVALWPLAPKPADDPTDPAAPAEANRTATSARRMLAERIADWLRARLDSGELLESRGRPMTPGDAMILVRGREARRGSAAFVAELVRALKTRNVPVAGQDRMVLTEQAAVADLLALAEALLLPEDDLNFACLLTSPLGGLDDDDLMALAMDRGKRSLADVLRARAAENPAWRRAWDFFATLRSRVDYATPYALFAEALGPLGGRARLFARLGHEAAEPIAELLNAALTYSAMHPPSLQGFVHWIARSGAEVKREAEAAGDLVRIMTVHGAKGLQAPIVILPDTTGLPVDRGSIFWEPDPAGTGPVPLWSPNKDLRSATIERARAIEAARQDEEYNRLLYVALTRAEDHLIVCGWESGKTRSDACWYSMVERGFAALPAERTGFADWGDALRFATPQIADPVRPRALSQDAAIAAPPPWFGAAPDWRAAPPPAEPARPMPLAPSRPDGADLGMVPAAASPLAERMGQGDRFVRGQAIHALLQHLPELPPERRAAAALRYLDRPGTGLPAGAAPAMVTEILRILEHPELAPLFGPNSKPEVPLTGVVGGYVVGGLVDRLAVLPDRVLLADFKTNRRPPESVADTPVLYRRQMALYRAVLRAIFPDRRVICALIWTRDARVVILPDEILDPHIPSPASDAA